MSVKTDGGCLMTTVPAPRVAGAAPSADPWDGFSDHAWIGWILDTARSRLGMDVAWLSKFSGGEQVVHAATGDLDAMNVQVGMNAPLEGSFCVRVLTGQLPPVVTAAGRDPRTRDLPVTHQLGIGSYVGAPIRGATGQPIGMLCCLSRHDGAGLEAGDARSLRFLAELINDRIRGNEPPPGPDLLHRRRRVRDVLDQGSVVAHFQPLVHMPTGEVVAYEALTRLTDHAGGSPASLFSDAAATGLGIAVEELAARRALEHVDRRPRHCPIAINLSPEALLQPSVLDLLMDHRHHGIGVEVTEHVPIEDYTPLIAVRESLRQAGIQLAVDDAGAGYASLRHILRLRPDIIKIDVGIVANLHRDPAKRALVSALATFAGETGARLLAEGVERVEERDALLSRHIHYGQGYLLGRPAPLDHRVPVGHHA